MSEDFIFPRIQTGRHTLITSLPKAEDFVDNTEGLHEARRIMPKIIIGDDINGVAPMVGPTPETWELIKKYAKPE